MGPEEWSHDDDEQQVTWAGQVDAALTYLAAMCHP